jgi:hypothetical protein
MTRKTDGFNTTRLAERQDRVLRGIKEGDPVSGEDYEALIDNPWIKWARKLAPNNLVIRNDCILDIADGSPKRKDLIQHQSIRLMDEGLWLEGYSYWLYTKAALDLYISKFNEKPIPKQLIENSFVNTSYRGIRNELWPAPFGDLRRQPLEEHLQIPDNIPDMKLGLVEKIGDKYIIKPNPAGLNTHAPAKRKIWYIELGAPFDADGKIFPFYTGYCSKYRNKFEEIADILNPRRILSLLKR